MAKTDRLEVAPDWSEVLANYLPRLTIKPQTTAELTLHTDSLTAAMLGVDTAFYFVHSMGSKSDFESEDRQAAQNFTDSARQAGVRRIIYLGGLGSRDKNLSKHLRSRQETGDVLRSSGVQVIELP